MSQPAEPSPACVRRRPWPLLSLETRLEGPLSAPRAMARIQTRMPPEKWKRKPALEPFYDRLGSSRGRLRELEFRGLRARVRRPCLRPCRQQPPNSFAEARGRLATFLWSVRR